MVNCEWLWHKCCMSIVCFLAWQQLFQGHRLDKDYSHLQNTHTRQIKSQEQEKVLNTTLLVSILLKWAGCYWLLLLICTDRCTKRSATEIYAHTHIDACTHTLFRSGTPPFAYCSCQGAVPLLGNAIFCQPKISSVCERLCLPLRSLLMREPIQKKINK